MSTTIEWTQGDDGRPGETWNPVRGCALVSPGCTNCYAMKQAHRFSGKGGAYEGLTKLRKKGGPVWTGKGRVPAEMLDAPLHWRKHRRVFVNSMSDLFFEKFTVAEIVKVFAVMAACPQHTFQVLTKRAARMRDVVSSIEDAVTEAGEELAAEHGWCHANEGAAWPLPNVWLGVSAENQEYADERIPDLLSTPAAVRFVSYEPALGPVDFGSYLDPYGEGATKLDWIIVGGESGPRARPFHVAWARAVIDQCKTAGVKCFVKQLGEHIVGDHEKDVDPGLVHRWYAPNGRRYLAPLFGPYLGLRPETAVAFQMCDGAGGNMSEWTPELRVREFPEARF